MIQKWSEYRVHCVATKHAMSVIEFLIGLYPQAVEATICRVFGHKRNQHWCDRCGKEL